MPQWKNKEEYEEWKAKMQKKNADVSNPANESPPPLESQSREIKWKLWLSAAAIILIFIGGFYIYKQLQGRAAYQNYKKDASATLIELEKLSATLEVGMTYIDYTKRLGEINFPVKNFLDKYQNYNLPTHPISYQVINNSMDSYLNLAKKWKIIIDANDSYLLSITKEHLGKGWTAIAYHLKLSRQILDEDKKSKKWKLLVDELISAQNLWNNEDVNYHKNIASYKEALKNQEEFLKDIGDKIKNIK